MDMWTMKDGQTIVASCKLGKPKDNCANLGAPLGISKNIRMISKVFSILQEDLKVRCIKVIHFHSGEKQG